MELKVVRYEVADRVATITLNRPDRLNAWTGRMHHEYRWAMAEADADSEVRAVVVTGAGRGFCAGADARALDGHVEKGAYDSGVVEDELPKPGLRRAPRVRPRLRLPLRTDRAGHRRRQRSRRRGGPGPGLLRRPPLRRRRRQAHDLGAPARPARRVRPVVDPPPPRRRRPRRRPAAVQPGRPGRARPSAWAWSTGSSPPTTCCPTTYEYARIFAEQVSPASVREAKRQLYADLHGDVGTAVAESERLLEEMVTGPDFAEGVAALQEKRPPAF